MALFGRFPKGGWRMKSALTHSTSMVRGQRGHCQGRHRAGAAGSRLNGEPLDAIVMELRTPRLGGIRRPTAHPGGVVHHGEGRLMIGRAIGRAAR